MELRLVSIKTCGAFDHFGKLRTVSDFALTTFLCPSNLIARLSNRYVR